MKAISIRNIPDDIYFTLRTMAKENRRSLQEQVKLMLEKEVELANKSILSSASQWRKRLEGRNFTDTVEMVREDRMR